ncbi:MAG: CvpA family protein [Acidimicrobiia bacterium]|nr:CvpA family protein [Acidimicrobiia bacterium]
MNWLDLLIAVILVVSAATGITRGFARAIVAIAATVIGVFAGIWTYGVAGAFLLDYVSHKSIANFIGFFLVFGTVILAGAVLGRLLAKLFKWVGLSWLDRLLGGGLGLVRGSLVSLAIVLVMCAFSRTPPPRAVAESRLAPYLMDAAGVAASLAPRELRDGFESSYEKVKELWNQTWKNRSQKLPTHEM